MTGLRGLEHVGMTSGDLDRTIAFYCGLLGLTLAVRKATEFGEMAFLDTGAGMLEIFAPRAPEVGRFRDIPPHEAGMRHLTFAFDDIGVVFDRLVAAGVDIVQQPRDAINRQLLKRVAFVRDGDGILVELVERAEGR